MRKRSRYRPRQPAPGGALGPLAHAVLHATRMQPEEVDNGRRIGAGALQTLKTETGEAARQAWRNLASILNIGCELAALGIVSDHDADFQAATDALAEIHHRHEAGRWALHAAEVAALDLMVDLWVIQLEHCSRGEYMRATRAVENKARGALAGNAPAGATVLA